MPHVRLSVALAIGCTLGPIGACSEFSMSSRHSAGSVAKSAPVGRNVVEDAGFSPPPECVEELSSRLHNRAGLDNRTQAAIQAGSAPALAACAVLYPHEGASVVHEALLRFSDIDAVVLIYERSQGGGRVASVRSSGDPGTVGCRTLAELPL